MSYDAAAEATKQAHELRALKEKQDYERMKIEQKKLEQEMADTLKQRCIHTSAESGGLGKNGPGKNGPGKNGPGKNGPEKTVRGVIGLVVESVKKIGSFR